MNEMRELTTDELDAVSGGFMRIPLLAYKRLACYGDGGGQNDPAQQFQQILQTLTGR